MKIIILHGEENSGKSTTINLVYHELLKMKCIQVENSFEILGEKDFKDILKLDDKLIGIISMGDYIIGKDSLLNHLKFMLEKECYICICAATSNKPKILESVLSNFKSVVISNSKETDQSKFRISNSSYSLKVIEEFIKIF